MDEYWVKKMHCFGGWGSQAER